MIPCYSRRCLNIVTALAWVAVVLTNMLCIRFVDAQAPANNSDAVSSEEFLRRVSTVTLPTYPTAHTFPIAGFPDRPVAQPESDSPSPASYTLPNPEPKSKPAVATAEYQSASPSDAPAIGSGVSLAPPVATAIPTVSSEPQTQLPWPSRIHNWLGLSSELPNFLVSYEAISLRRGNDDAGSFTSGQVIDRLGRDMAGRTTVARLLGGMDQAEFVFTGPFHWDREMTVTGSLDANLSTGSLPSSALGALQGADSHHQWHSTNLNSYELNRRWSTDGMSNIMYGLRIIDYREKFELNSVQGLNTGRLRLDTTNVLIGNQVGVNLARPLSQRLLMGYGTGLGMFGNFATGSLQIEDGVTSLADKSDERMRLTGLVQASGFLRYHVTANTVFFGGYEWWYFTGLATVSEQRLGNVLAPDRLSLRTGDDQLFRGWSVGLSAKF